MKAIKFSILIKISEIYDYKIYLNLSRTVSKWILCARQKRCTNLQQPFVKLRR